MGFMEAAVGGRSVGVPGVLRMLELAHRRHGRLPWSELFHAAIRTADEGFLPTPKLRAALERENHLRDDPAARRVYYSGERVVNREYADTLRLDRARRRAGVLRRRRGEGHRACRPHARQARRPHRRGSARLSRHRARTGLRPLPGAAPVLDGTAELGRRRRAADPRAAGAHRLRARAAAVRRRAAFLRRGRQARLRRSRALPGRSRHLSPFP